MRKICLFLMPIGIFLSKLSQMNIPCSRKLKENSREFSADDTSGAFLWSVSTNPNSSLRSIYGPRKNPCPRLATLLLVRVDHQFKTMILQCNISFAYKNQSTHKQGTSNLKSKILNSVKLLPIAFQFSYTVGSAEKMTLLIS